MRLFSICLFFVFFTFYSAFSANQSFDGKVIDAHTKLPLQGAAVAIHDLKTNAITDDNGYFNFNRMPDKGKFLVQVSYLGYKYQSKWIDFSNTRSVIFEMQPSLMEAGEVVVTGSVTGADSKKNSTSVVVLSHDAMLDRSSTNIIDAISKVAGVSQITSGQAISKPVIRGLSFNRIVTINKGVKQQGQQWGDEHGIEIDQFSADRIEILRGAASLLYGADALGGVINILEPLAVSDGIFKGEILTNYSTNGGLSSNSLMLTGNANGFVWRSRGSYKSAYSFKTPDYYYPNSGYKETSAEAMIGFNKSWGYSHLNVSYFKNDIGFYDPVVNVQGDFLDQSGNPYKLGELKERNIAYPKQNIAHFKIASNSNFVLKNGSLKLDLGYQNNIRKELPDANPALFFDLNTYSLDAKFNQEIRYGWQPVIGLSTDYANSLNKGSEYLVPNYSNWGLGIFYYLKKEWDNSSFNAGLRYDFRNNIGKDLFENGDQKFTAFHKSFSNLSGAVGFTSQITEKFNVKANLSTGFRAPNPAEQASNGIHEGTFRYEVGDANLAAEKSYQADVSFQFSTEIFDLNLSIYNNYMSDYIYLAQNNSETIIANNENGLPESFPLFRYQQDDANLHGSDISLIFHPYKYLHIENTYSFVYAKNLALNSPLPFIPTASLKNELRFEPNIKGLKSAYVSLGLDNYFSQNRIAIFETKTNGYSLVSASFGTKINLGKQLVRLNFSAINLFNKSYYDHLSRFKPGRLSDSDPDFGIYNPGRNFSFGISLPLNF